MAVFNATTEQWDEMMAAFNRSDKWRADQMPDEPAALRVLNEAFNRLKELGWREAIYAPNNEPLELIELGSTGVHRGTRGLYENDDGFWIRDGDVWPSRPVLWRKEKPSDPKPDDAQGGK